MRYPDLHLDYAQASDTEKAREARRHARMWAAKMDQAPPVGSEAILPKPVGVDDAIGWMARRAFVETEARIARHAAALDRLTRRHF